MHTGIGWLVLEQVAIDWRSNLRFGRFGWDTFLHVFVVPLRINAFDAVETRVQRVGANTTEYVSCLFSSLGRCCTEKVEALGTQ